MTSSPLLQRTQSTAKTESQILRHPDADNYVSFLCAVSMLRDRGEGNANDALFMGQLREQIDVQWRDPILEYHKPVVPVFDLTYGSRHSSFSLRNTGRRELTADGHAPDLRNVMESENTREPV